MACKMNEWGLLRQQFNELKDVTLTVKDGKPGTFQVEAGFWPKRAADFRLLATGAAKRLTGIARPDLWFQHVYENCLPGEFRLDQSFPAPVSEVETDGTERPVTVELWSTAGNAGTICGNAAGRLADDSSHVPYKKSEQECGSVRTRTRTAKKLNKIFLSLTRLGSVSFLIALLRPRITAKRLVNVSWT